MASKKGVSPLIATVLLLAFAVALATVIIQIYPASTCKLSQVYISVLGGSERICYDGEKGEISAFITNEGKDPLVGFKIRASGELDTLNIGKIPLKIDPKGEKKLVFDYNTEKYGKLLSLEIFPLANMTGTIEECEMKTDISSVPACS